MRPATLAALAVAFLASQSPAPAPRQLAPRKPTIARDTTITPKSRKVTVTVGPGTEPVTITVEMGGTSEPVSPPDAPPVKTIDGAVLYRDKCAECHTIPDPKGKYPLFFESGKPVPLVESYRKDVKESMRNLSMPPDQPLTDREFNAVAAYLDGLFDGLSATSR